jgi:hypothetical protein
VMSRPSEESTPVYVSRGMMKMSSAIIKSTPTMTQMMLLFMSLLSPA